MTTDAFFIQVSSKPYEKFMEYLKPR